MQHNTLDLHLFSMKTPTKGTPAVECVYAVIEVKSNLDNGELDEVFQNMKWFGLEKKAYVEDAMLQIRGHFG